MQRLRFPFGLGFTISARAPRFREPNRVRHPTDWSFTFSCSPRHLAMTQLLLVTGFHIGPVRTFIRLFSLPRRRTQKLPAQLNLFPVCEGRLCTASDGILSRRLSSHVTILMFL